MKVKVSVSNDKAVQMTNNNNLIFTVMPKIKYVPSVS